MLPAASVSTSLPTLRSVCMIRPDSGQNIVKQNDESQNIDDAKYQKQNIESPADLLLSELEFRGKNIVMIVTRRSNWYINLTLAGTGHFASFHGTSGGSWYDPPPLAVSPLIELELRGKNERVARHETKKLVYKLKVLGKQMTSEVRSSAEK